MTIDRSNRFDDVSFPIRIVEQRFARSRCLQNGQWIVKRTKWTIISTVWKRKSVAKRISTGKIFRRCHFTSIDPSFSLSLSQRYSQIEDHLEEIKRENEEKLSSLESIVKIFEIKARNAADHIGRLEEKESEMKQEYKRLHDRYGEVSRSNSFSSSFSFVRSSYFKLIAITWNGWRFFMALKFLRVQRWSLRRTVTMQQWILVSDAQNVEDRSSTIVFSEIDWVDVNERWSCMERFRSDRFRSMLFHFVVVIVIVVLHVFERFFCL